MADVYDRIGRSYTDHRRPDPRIARQITRAIGNAASVVNVGAGAGSYEPGSGEPGSGEPGVGSAIAVEPSEVMIAQRPPDAHPVVRAVAETLPFADAQFDVALAVLTVHHWSDPDAGLRELRRVARRQVVLTWDHDVIAGPTFWLTRDYVPAVVDFDAALASFRTVHQALAPARVEVVPVSHDCTDGFLGAYWRRPEAYLDPAVRASISGLALVDDAGLQQGLDRLARDLGSGAWHRRNAAILDAPELDLGYRLVVAGPGDPWGGTQPAAVR